MKTSRKPNRKDTIRETLRLLRLDGELIELGTYVDQVYSFETDDGWQYHWSIVEAKKRAEAKGELTTISLTDAGMTLETVRLMNQGLDERYAMRTNLLKAILFAPFTNAEGSQVHVLIDGWHRVFHAVSIGVDILPCYVLTQEDADASLIIKLPPGQGLPFDDCLTTIVVEEDTKAKTKSV